MASKPLNEGTFEHATREPLKSETSERANEGGLKMDDTPRLLHSEKWGMRKGQRIASIHDLFDAAERRDARAGAPLRPRVAWEVVSYV